MNSRYVIARDTLLAKGYVKCFSNHPSAELREFHFIKDRIRCIVRIGQTSDMFYCKLYADIQKSIVLHIESQSYAVEDIRLDAVHANMLAILEKLDT